MAFNPDAYLQSRSQQAPEVPMEPAQSTTQFDPNNWAQSKYGQIKEADPEYAQTLEADPAFKSFGKAALGAAVPTAAGFAGGRLGAIAGAKAGTALALGLGVAGPQAAAPEELVTVPIFAGAGALIGGLIGAIGLGGIANKVQEKAAKATFGDEKVDEWLRQAAINRKEHPIATMAGEFAPSAAVIGFSVKNVKNAYQFGKVAIKLKKPAVIAKFMRDPDSAAQMANLIDVGIGGATEGGQEAMRQIQEGDLRPVRLAMATMLGLAQNQPTKFGRALGFAPAGKLTPAAEIAKHLDAIDTMKADILLEPGSTKKSVNPVTESGKSIEDIRAGDMEKGDTVEIDGDPHKVIEKTDDGGVVLKDGTQQTLKPDDNVAFDKDSYEFKEDSFDTGKMDAETPPPEVAPEVEVDGQPVPPQPDVPTRPIGGIERIIKKGKAFFSQPDQGQFKYDAKEQAADPSKANTMRLQGLMQESRQKVYDYFHQPKTLKRVKDTLLKRGFDQRHINKMINKGGMDSDTFARFIAELDKADGASTQSERATTALFEAMDELTPRHPEGGRGDQLRDDFFHFTRDTVTAEIDPNIKHAMGVKTPEAVKYLEDMKLNHPETYKQLVESADVYDKMLKAATIDEEYRLGMISEEQYKGLTEKHSFYEPQVYLHHAEPGNYGKKGDVIAAPIKKLDGGSEEAILLNSKALAARNITSHKTRQAWNQANKAQYDAVKANPEYYKKLGMEVWDRKAVAPNGKRKLGGYHEGGKEFSIIAPEEFVKDWYREVPLLQDPSLKMAQTLSGSKLVKLFATGAGNPFFFLSNIPMDVGLRFISDTDINKWAPAFGATMAKNMKDVWKDVRTKTGRYTELTDSGWNPGHSFTGEGGIVPKAWESSVSPVKKQMFKLQQVMSQLNEWSEGLTRVAYAKSVEDALIAKGTTPEMAKIKGLNAAKSSPNFGQWGETTKLLDMFVPYLNPAVQATGSALRSAKKNPALFAHKTGQLATVGFMLAYWNKQANPDAWDSISDREKVNNFIITTPFSFKDSQGRTRHVYLRIRTDQASRIFKQIGQEVAEGTLGGQGQDDRIKMALNELSPADVSSLVPPTLSAALGYMTNKDFWRNQDIWQGAPVPAEAEYTADTPLPWVKLGEATGLSPERAQRATESVIPANPFTAAMGMGYDAIMPKDKEIHKTMTDKIMNIPGVSRILRVTRPQELSKRQQSKAKALKIDAKDSPTEIKRQIKTKGMDRAGMRQKLNVEADRIIEQILTKEKKAPDFYKWLQTVPDMVERKRLLRRYKEKRAAIRK